jgi:hypothetical protein
MMRLRNTDQNDAAPAPTLLYTIATFWKQSKVNLRFGAIVSSDKYEWEN